MLFDNLTSYSKSGMYPMHMPGHKRNTDLLGSVLPYELDITEIPGFNNLSDPRGVFSDLSELAAALYGSEKTFLLVNGSTVGILAVIGACTNRGDTIIIARNCHMSVYNAVEVFGLTAEYLYPDIDESSGILCSITPENLEITLEKHPDTRLVVITSPTYDGVTSDISTLSKVTRAKGIPLFVDEAHGAHFGFSGYFPKNAQRLGADVSVMSLHKTLPALTQCALLHVGGNNIDYGEIARTLAMLQTSSPSYVLTASISRCLTLLEKNGAGLFRDYEKRLDKFRSDMSRLHRLKIISGGSMHLGFYGFDLGKIIISTTDTPLTGVDLARLVREEYKIELEMASRDYALGISSICDTDTGFAVLSKALDAIDKYLSPSERRTTEKPPRPVRAKTVEAALPRNSKTEFIPISKAQNRISGEYMRAFPPGIPILTPGEIISREMCDYLTQTESCGIELSGTSGSPKGCVSVLI